MSRWSLEDDRRVEVLKPLAKILDERFGFDTPWVVSDERISKLVPIEESNEEEDYIIICPEQVQADMRRAEISNRYEEFCLFYVMAHEKVHAFQGPRERKRGLNFLRSYHANSVRYELEADHIAGLLHFEEQLIEIGERKYVESGGVLDTKVSAFSFSDTQVGPVVASLANSIGSPTTHGSGAQRSSEFLWGRAWSASARARGRLFEDFWPEFLKAAEEKAGT